MHRPVYVVVGASAVKVRRLAGEISSCTGLKVISADSLVAADPAHTGCVSPDDVAKQFCDTIEAYSERGFIVDGAILADCPATVDALRLFLEKHSHCRVLAVDLHSQENSVTDDTYWDPLTGSVYLANELPAIIPATRALSEAEEDGVVTEIPDSDNNNAVDNTGSSQQLSNTVHETEAVSLLDAEPAYNELDYATMQQLIASEQRIVPEKTIIPGADDVVFEADKSPVASSDQLADSTAAAKSADTVEREHRIQRYRTVKQLAADLSSAPEPVPAVEIMQRLLKVRLPASSPAKLPAALMKYIDKQLEISGHQNWPSIVHHFQYWHRYEGSARYKYSTKTRTVKVDAEIGAMPPKQAMLKLTSPQKDGDGELPRFPSVFGHFCPVSWHDTKALVEGSTLYSRTYKRNLFFLANEEAAQRFDSSPEKFTSNSSDFSEDVACAPEEFAIAEDDAVVAFLTESRFHAYCPVKLKRTGQLVQTNKELCLLYRGQKYYFATPQERDAFMGSPREFADQITAIPPPRIFVAAGDDTNATEDCVQLFASLDLHGVAMVQFHTLLAAADNDKKLALFFLYTAGSAFKEKGFVVLGFPQSADDCALILDAATQWPHDATIIIDNQGGDESQHSDQVAQVLINGGGVLHRFDRSKGRRQCAVDLQEYFDSLLLSRDTIFARPLAIETALANNLVDTEWAELSSFGRFCPVALNEKQLLKKQSIGSVPVLFSDTVYYLKSRANVELFKRNPSQYVSQPADINCLVPIILVTGTKDVVNEIAARMAMLLEMAVVDFSELDHGENDWQAVENRCRAAVHATRGTIVTGFPSTRRQFELIDREKLTARVIIIEFGEVLDGKLAVCELADDYFGVWKNIASNDGNKFQMARQALKHIRVVTAAREEVVRARSSDAAVLCANTGIQKSDCLQKLGPVQRYCPVSLVDRNELILADTFDYLVEFKGQYFVCADAAEAARFIASPNLYASVQVPEKIPRIVLFRDLPNGVDYPMSLEYQGYCPVHLQSTVNPLHDAMVGSSDFLAEYGGKYYAFASQCCLDKFMRKPTSFCNIQLPVRMPRRMDDKSSIGLPVVGYLDETMSGVLQHALLTVGSKKFVYPFQPAAVSAIHYLALTLCANNPNLSPTLRRLYDERLQKFEETCQASLSAGKSSMAVDALFRLKSVAMP